MLRGDFHMHTAFSHDCTTSPEALARRCEEVGLGCIAVTDHNRLGGAVAVKSAAPFMVILGEEIKSTEGEVTGLFLEEEIPAGLTLLETVKRVKEQGALVSVPHPFVGMGRSALGRRSVMDILPYVDIMERFNARTMKGSDNQAARRFAAELGLVTTAVSDSHTLGELGRTFTELPDFDGTPGGFLAALREAQFIERPAGALVHAYTFAAKLRSRLSRGP